MCIPTSNQIDCRDIISFKPLKQEVPVDKNQLRELITAVLRYLEPEIPFSEDAVELLMMTAAVESELGEAVKQKGGGPAKGIFQVEPTTERDVMNRFLNPKKKKRQSLREKVLRLAGNPPPGIDPAIYDLDYQIALTRCFYRMKPKALPTVFIIDGRPDYDSIVRMAKYYKKHFNTVLGKSTVKKAIDKYCKYAV